MTDYFALLDQPRRPSLDEDELKQAFHERSRLLHPDARGDNAGGQVPSDGAFAQLNEAYQVLQDPKRRIQHLLALADRAAARQSSVPRDIADLFPIVAGVTHEADALVQKMEAATTPLSRSLLKAQMLAVRTRVADTLQQLRTLYDSANTALERFGPATAYGEGEWAGLHELYLRFSYLTRWISELEEKQVRVAA